MEDRGSYCQCKFTNMALIKINQIIKDKYGVKLKYPNRQCKDCKKYPCFYGIDKCLSNFAAYGCVYYKDSNI